MENVQPDCISTLMEMNLNAVLFSWLSATDAITAEVSWLLQLDDGILDVMVVNEFSLAKIAKVLPIYQAGKHFANGEIVPELENIVEYYPAKSVHIRPVDENQEVIVNVDGECGPDKELSAEIVPLSARLILPKKVYDKQM